jgi:hypothetical protein
VQVDPGQNLFATPGRRADLIALAASKPAGQQNTLGKVSFDFAVLPNGGGERGLQQYRAFVPVTADVAFPIELRGDDDVVEFLIDNFSISRLDAPSGAAP